MVLLQVFSLIILKLYIKSCRRSAIQRWRGGFYCCILSDIISNGLPPEEENKANSEVWNRIANGLPETSGTIISIILANLKVAGEFYAINNRGTFCSTDSGVSWKILDGIVWPKEYLLQHPGSCSKIRIGCGINELFKPGNLSVLGNWLLMLIMISP